MSMSLMKYMSRQCLLDTHIPYFGGQFAISLLICTLPLISWNNQYLS